MMNIIGIFAITKNMNPLKIAKHPPPFLKTTLKLRVLLKIFHKLMLTNPCYINRDYIVFSFKTVVKIFIFFFSKRKYNCFLIIYDLIFTNGWCF